MIEPGRNIHVDEILENLSEASAFDSPTRLEVLQEIAKSDICWAGRHNGRLLCLAGVRRLTLTDNQGYLWMLTVKKLPGKIFIKEGREVVKSLLNHYSCLYGFCDARADGWLRMFGAVPMEVVNTQGRSLRRFEIRRI